MNSTLFSIQTRLQCVLAFQKTKWGRGFFFYLKTWNWKGSVQSRDLWNKTWRPKWKYWHARINRNHKEKEKRSKRTRGVRGNLLFFLQYYPRLRWKRQALGSAPVLENLRGRKSGVLEFSFPRHETMVIKAFHKLLGNFLATSRILSNFFRFGQPFAFWVISLVTVKFRK